jgi:hypothetical protein
LSSTRQANQHHVTPAVESAGQPPNRVFERYNLTVTDLDLERIHRKSVLCGLINEYSRAA